ncbi:Nucleoside-diphosphate-sugar epimerase [Neofusicoccum parvum]|nr:Nucleoside-diphosphate-sugar epimerase [Neofusicoccum parvum]
MVKIFAIGVTGWIGGDAAHRIATAHPEYEWTILVRSDAKAAEAATYGLPPSTRFVIGDYDSRNLLATEAAAADIVINWANSDEAAGVSVLLEGLKTKKEPGYFIHLSGAAILAWDDQVSGKYGEESPKVYDDWDGLEEVTSLPDAAMHRPVEKIVLEAGDEVRTAIVSPPWIYGRSRASPVEHSVATTTISMFQAHGKGFRVGQGTARWGTVHIHDLSEVFLRLVEEAVKGGGAATWGRQGYYFVESGDVALGEVNAALAKVMFQNGLLETPELDTLDREAAEKVTPFALVIWGWNARPKAVRARKSLGWEPAILNGVVEDVQDWRWGPGSNTIKPFELPKGMVGNLEA